MDVRIKLENPSELHTGGDYTRFTPACIDLKTIKEEISVTEDQRLTGHNDEITTESCRVHAFLNNDIDHIKIKVELFTTEEMDIKEETDTWEMPVNDYLTLCFLENPVENGAQTREKRLHCTVCDYKTSDRSNLRRHLKMHTGEKSYHCNFCSYKASENNKLQRHIKIHTGEKPFHCTICNFKCSRKSYLQTHVKRHTGEKPFRCTICGYQCTQKNNLQRHVSVHTGEQPYHCVACAFKCFDKSHLERHVKVHTGEKPFRCTICDYKSSQKSVLQRHMKIHSGLQIEILKCAGEEPL